MIVRNKVYRGAIDSFCSARVGRTKVCVSLCGSVAKLFFQPFYESHHL